jgi:hypothetical protein
MQADPASPARHNEENLMTAKLIPPSNDQNIEMPGQAVPVANMEANPPSRLSKLLEAMCCWAHSRM